MECLLDNFSSFWRSCFHHIILILLCTIRKNKGETKIKINSYLRCSSLLVCRTRHLLCFSHLQRWHRGRKETRIKSPSFWRRNEELLSQFLGIRQGCPIGRMVLTTEFSLFINAQSTLRTNNVLICLFLFSVTVICHWIGVNSGREGWIETKLPEANRCDFS